MKKNYTIPVCLALLTGLAGQVFGQGTLYGRVDQPKITLQKTLDIDWEIKSLLAPEAERNSIWIDWNNNGSYESGEEVTTFGQPIKHSFDSETITIYGKVTHLSCNGLQLTSLDVTENTNLDSLFCNYNKLELLDLSGQTNLQKLNCSDNKLQTLTLTGLSRLTELKCSSNELKELDLTGNPNLVRLLCGINKLTRLSLQNMEQLTLLSCYMNLQLTDLDLRGCDALQYIYCYYNNLTDDSQANLELGKKKDLKHLWASFNRFTKIDLSGLGSLESVMCSGNKLSEIKLDGTPRLHTLQIAGNLLTEVDLSGKPQLKTVHLMANRISGDTMDRMLQDLPDRSSLGEEGRGSATVIDTKAKEGEESNVCYDTTVQALKAKNWNVYDLRGNENAGMNDYSGTPRGTEALAPEGSVSLYPNPAADCVGVSGLTCGDEIALIDAAGQMLYAARVQSAGFLDIYVENYAPGNYLLLVNGNPHPLIIR